MKILLDACGLDKGPSVVIEAGKKAKDELNLEIAIIGLKEIEDEVRRNNLEFILADEEIFINEENPAFAIRQKKNSTISKGMRLVKEGVFSAFVSGGSTGALLAGGMTIIGRIPGVKRACLMAKLPNKKSHSYFLDIGANVDIAPDVLLSFAILADRYVRLIENKVPSIMLLNNGVEENKGTEFTKASHKLLKESGLNFIGNIESRDIFDGLCDIIITDGFTGNIILKSIEGLFKHFFYLFKELSKESFMAKLGLALLYKPMKSKFKNLDSSKHGGVPLLGIKNVVIKAHGSSDTYAFYNSIKACKETIESNMIEEFYKSFDKED